MPDEIYGVMAVKNGQKQTIMNLSNARQKSYADLQNMTDAQKKGVIVCPDYPTEEFLVTADEVSYGSGTVKDALDSLATDFALGSETKLYIPIKYTTNYSFMYLHIYGIYAGTNTAFQSAISARNSSNTWVCSSTDTNIAVDKFGDNLRITFPSAYAAGTYSVKYAHVH